MTSDWQQAIVWQTNDDQLLRSAADMRRGFVRAIMVRVSIVVAQLLFNVVATTICCPKGREVRGS